MSTPAETSDGCKSCRGYCCYRFQIGGLQPDAEGRPDWDRYIQQYSPFPHEIEEVRDLFVARAKEYIGRPEDVTLTCRKFDIRSGRCTIYETRPKVCRRFLCDEALGGRDPDTASMETGGAHPFPRQKLCLARLDKRWAERHRSSTEAAVDAAEDKPAEARREQEDQHDI